jgi:hypothetical protein
MNRSLGRFKLPQPLDIQEENEWLPIPKVARTVPFGYKVNEEDPDILDPIPDELNKLQQAKKYLSQYSYREVANWLSTNTGRSISHVGLMKRLTNEQRHKKQATSLRNWADYAKKAIAKAEKIESQRTGARRKVVTA